MKGYKAFKKGMVCLNKQYAENTVFEEEEADVCRKGMHFCKNPMDCLDYYPLIDDDGNVVEIAEVEALDEAKTDDNKKFCTKKMKVGAKVGIKGLVDGFIGFVKEETKIESGVADASGNGAQLASSGNEAQLASSGNVAQLASSGNEAQLASSGNVAQLASSGYGAKLASSGDCAKLASSGHGAQLASSGDCAKLASSGDCAKLASSGNGAQLASSGYGAQLASSGDCAKLASSGYGAKLASSGYGAQLASSGDCAKLASSGHGAKLASSGKNSVVANIGVNGKAKASIGSWITIAEYGDWSGTYSPCKCVKSFRIDGKKYKPDTWYTLKNGKVVEAE